MTVQLGMGPIVGAKYLSCAAYSSELLVWDPDALLALSERMNLLVSRHSILEMPAKVSGGTLVAINPASLRVNNRAARGRRW
jgi:hypothetical protein